MKKSLRGILNIRESVEMIYITRNCMNFDEIILYLKGALKNHKKWIKIKRREEENE